MTVFAGCTRVGSCGGARWRGLHGGPRRQGCASLGPHSPPPRLSLALQTCDLQHRPPLQRASWHDRPPVVPGTHRSPPLYPRSHTRRRTSMPEIAIGNDLLEGRAGAVARDTRTHRNAASPSPLRSPASGSSTASPATSPRGPGGVAKWRDTGDRANVAAVRQSAGPVRPLEGGVRTGQEVDVVCRLCAPSASRPSPCSSRTAPRRPCCCGPPAPRATWCTTCSPR